MPQLKNPRHEKFAQLVASGKYTLTAAYREIYPSSRRWKDVTLHPRASRLMCKVYARVQELQAAAAEKAVIYKASILGYLRDVILTPIGQLDASSPLVQRYVVRGDTVIITMPSKIGAVQELAKALGWYQADKHEQSFKFVPDAKVIEMLED